MENELNLPTSKWVKEVKRNVEVSTMEKIIKIRKKRDEFSNGYEYEMYSKQIEELENNICHECHKPFYDTPITITRTPSNKT